ncbi:MAG: hypothetical protein KKB59_14255 [Spirochaetes bacterium]|nr:hypothetical protein [Spirochaetota bacterium]
MPDIRFSVPQPVHSWIMEAGALRGFTGKYGVSAFARFLAYEALHLTSGFKPRPIIVQPTYEQQRIELEAYAMAMGYDSVEGFALKAMERIMSKESATGRRGEAYEAIRAKLLAESQEEAIAVQQEASAAM